ncbi:MAG: hypothetical protein IT530_07750 [Burkholderiales bacterium]|nr:hypothetical protein [Burkholderiales bacterium]
MKAVFDRVLAMVLSLVAGTCFAQAIDEGAASAPEPTVSVVWVVVFLAIFVGICAWIGIAIWRNERKNRKGT